MTIFKFLHIFLIYNYFSCISPIILSYLLPPPTTSSQQATLLLTYLCVCGPLHLAKVACLSVGGSFCGTF